MATTVDRVTLKTDIFKVSLAIVRGETFDKTVTWKAGETSETVAPVDLTGATARADVRVKRDSAAVVLQLSTENGRLVLGDAAGTVRILIDDATTAALEPGRYVWDLEFVIDGAVIPKMAGSVTVTGEVTRPEGEE